jgi:phage shock protein A
VGEAVSGISDSTRSAGATMQRAQDKIASMQARAGAIDELLASGALDDLTQPVDDIQKELDKVSSTSQVDNELAALRAEIGSGSADGAAALPSADEVHDAEEVKEVKEVNEVKEVKDPTGETVGGTGGESA